MKSSVEQECYRLVQQIAVTKHPVCVRCGDPSTCGHHIFTRSRPGTTFDPDAVIGMCAECHAWAHRWPNYAILVAQSVIGITKYYRLEKKSREVCRYRVSDFREIRQRLREILKQTERDLNANNRRDYRHHTADMQDI